MNQSGIYISKDQFVKNDDCLKVKFDGKKIHDFTRFYESIKRKLKFPSYFGDNLDALEECLQDLSWINKDQVIVKFENSEELLSNENKEDVLVLWQILENTAEFWKNENLEFIILKL